MSVVVLTGFMGTGKTTVGKRLAERLHKPFIDTDARIEQLEGQSVAAIFTGKGEPYFRAIERRVLAEVLPMDAVVATGGGAIADAENYARMRTDGPIVCLTADVDVIMRRTGADRSRPLLSEGDRGARVRQLLSERAAAYGKADLTVDTSSGDLEAVVDEIVAFLCRARASEVHQ